MEYLRSKTSASREHIVIRRSITPALRIELTLKGALRTALEREHRYIANMVEVLILDWCRRNRIVISAKAMVSAQDPCPHL